MSNQMFVKVKDDSGAEWIVNTQRISAVKFNNEEAEIFCASAKVTIAREEFMSRIAPRIESNIDPITYEPGDGRFYEQ